MIRMERNGMEEIGRTRAGATLACTQLPPAPPPSLRAAEQVLLVQCLEAAAAASCRERWRASVRGSNTLRARFVIQCVELLNGLL